jgi:hypothetical protein
MIPVTACFPGPMGQVSKGAQYSREVLSVSYVGRLLTSETLHKNTCCIGPGLCKILGE